jgi:hypothetical protein
LIKANECRGYAGVDQNSYGCKTNLEFIAEHNMHITTYLMALQTDCLTIPADVACLKTKSQMKQCFSTQLQIKLVGGGIRENLLEKAAECAGRHNTNWFTNYGTLS